MTVDCRRALRCTTTWCCWASMRLALRSPSSFASRRYASISRPLLPLAWVSFVRYLTPYAQGEEVLCVQLDPDLHDRFRSFYRFGAANACKQGTGEGRPLLLLVRALLLVYSFLYSHDRSPLTRVRNADGGVCSNIYSQYADPNNPDTWNHFELHHAKLVVSCQQARILKSLNTVKL